MTRRRAETRRRLLDAALDVFAERGLRGASIEEVCDRAGYTRGAFYSNFRTLDELLLAVSEDYSDQILDRLRSALLNLPDDLPDGEEVLDAALEMVLAVLPDDRRWWLVETELVLHAARNPEAAEAAERLRRRFAAEFTSLVTWAIRRVGREFTCPPEDLVRVIHALLDGAQAQRHLEPDAVPPGRLERLALPALLRAFSRPAGAPH
ncbi:MAG TPA: TetR/AcrR family transcriptional regulator, partial [Thermomonospora sp.]|nr:TetR/AcrR family transcriptional regulator [Thermomonospora sp.]